MRARSHGKATAAVPLLIVLTASAILGAARAEAADDEAALYVRPGAVEPAGEIDRIVFAKLKSMGVEPVLCSDAVFVRRAFIDVIGTLPTADEARAFIDDPDIAGKRARLIDHLLTRDEFADYWSMKWGDVLRIKAEFPVNLWPNAAQAYHRWVRESIAANKPFDQFARELLTSSGSNFRVGPVNFYRAIQNRTPEGIAGAVALTLMGSRLDAWPKERSEGMAAFFTQVGYKPTREWKEEIVFWDPLRTSARRAAANVAAEKPDDTAKKPEVPAPATFAAPAPISTVFLDGTKVMVPTNRDPREVFADWLIRPDNPWFTRAISNRAWGWLMGRGVVHEPDDIRDDNPPSNPELMAYLEKEVAAGKYDLKRFYRLVLTSNTYQMSSLSTGIDEKARAQFARYPLRRLEAEVLIDALNAITGTTDLYTSPIPEPFTYIPQDQPAIAIADGSITSSFLTLFGRSARATGMENERNNNPVPSQWMHMLNSTQVQRKLETGPKLQALLTSTGKAEKVLDQLYLTILSRRPTADERRVMGAYFQKAKVKKEAAVDMAWALINSPEFLYRH
jgi:hypothetical protein